MTSDPIKISRSLLTEFKNNTAPLADGKGPKSPKISTKRPRAKLGCVWVFYENTLAFFKQGTVTAIELFKVLLK
ncbi:MAG: hypothetical protein V1760_03120 [Candidatus Peregrinibacteria bacterium]